jgi:hypothetical protein
MRFTDTLPQLFVGADPDTKNAAYAAVDLEGNVVEAFTVDRNFQILWRSLKDSRSIRTIRSPILRT